MLQYVPLMGSLILGMGTKQSSYVEISKKIGFHTEIDLEEGLRRTIKWYKETHSEKVVS